MKTCGYVVSGDASIYYESEGSGIPVLLLHGNGQSHAVFAAYADALKASYQVILPDSRAHGLSRWRGGAKEKPRLSTDLLAEDVKCILDALHLKRAVLFGFSDGANVALEAASRYPERVLAVIVANGNALPQGLAFPVYEAVRLQSAVCSAAERICPLRGLRKALSHRRALNELLLSSPGLSAARLHLIKAPVLLLAGDCDIIRLPHTKWMAAQIPQAKLVVFKGGTHALLFQRKEDCLDLIRSFLSGLRAGS